MQLCWLSFIWWHDIQHNNTQHKDTQLNDIQHSECRNAECRYAERCCANNHYHSDSRGALKLLAFAEFKMALRLINHNILANSNITRKIRVEKDWYLYKMWKWNVFKINIHHNLKGSIMLKFWLMLIATCYVTLIRGYQQHYTYSKKWVWQSLQTVHLFYKIFTSRIDKYWPRQQMLCSF